MADDKHDEGRQRNVLKGPKVGSPGLTQIPPVKQSEQTDKTEERKDDAKKGDHR